MTRLSSVAGALALVTSFVASGCLVSNLPGSARPAGAGVTELDVVNQIAVTLEDDAEKADLTAIGGSLFGLGIGDLGFIHGISDRVDVGVRGGISGTLGGSLKGLLVHTGPLWVAAFGEGRFYYLAPELRLAHAGLIATLGNGPVAFSFGGFAGNMWGKTKETDTEPARTVDGPYVGGGLGFEAQSSMFVHQAMFELQRYTIDDFKAYTAMVTLHTKFGARER
ncbi:MAG: hypothetical protein R2939_09270 [Kofleriaceae bacterium]